MAEAIPNRDEEKTKQSVIYRKGFNLQRIDLIGDFGGKDLFLIDGDSLIAYFLLPNTYGDHFLSPLKQIYKRDEILEESSVLYLIYLVEEFLADILERGGCFHIIFFNSHGHFLCGTDSRLSAYREILRLHLRVNTSHKVFWFDSWLSDQIWNEYFFKWKPLFVLIYGGLTETELGSEKEFQNYSTWNEAFENFCIDNKVSIAYLTELQLTGGRIVAYVKYFTKQFVTNIYIKNCQRLMVEYISVKVTEKKYLSVFADISKRFHANQDLRLALCVGFLKSERQEFESNSLRILVAKVLLFHTIILSKIPISYRSLSAFKVHRDVKQSVHDILKKYYRLAFQYLKQDRTDTYYSSLNKPINIFDLVDEKILLRIVQMIVNGQLTWNEVSVTDQQIIGCEWYDNVLTSTENRIQLDFFKSEETELSNLKVHQGQEDFDKIEKLLTTNSERYEEENFFPIDNDFFKQEFYKHDTSTLQASEETSNSIYHTENRHWHSYHEVEQKKIKLDKKGLTSEQKYMKFVQQYASSLTGVKGLYNKLIVPKVAKGENRKSKSVSAASKKIQEDNRKRKDEVEIKKSKELLMSLKNNVERINDFSELLHLFESRAPKIIEYPNDIVFLALHWLKLDILLKQWIHFCQHDIQAKKDNRKKLVELFEHLGIISNDCGDTLSTMPYLYADLNRVCKMLGYKSFFMENSISPDRIQLNDGSQSNDQSQHLSASQINLKKSTKVKSKIKDESSKITAFDMTSRDKTMFPELKLSKASKDPEIYLGKINPIELQLIYMAGFMNRCNASGSLNDSRVSFKPDEWQVELLNIIDKNESALVSAPTSSGKTYVAYYAMERVLSENNEDIVVYVAPTKALVNQVATEVYARYKKTYPKGGMSVWGIWTREYRHNPMDCQILITVPDMLEILLLSPSHLEWSRKIKRIIFDEIHCIGNLQGGRVWEHLLLMCTMPILCLSATLGSPELFLKWLQSIQERHNIKVHFVRCPLRHSDLAKYKYIKPPTERNQNAIRMRRKGAFEFIHPWGSLSLNVILHSGIPLSAKLSPEECMLVSEAIKMIETENQSTRRLYAENYFADNSFIKRSQVMEYEDELRDFLTKLASIDRIAFEEIINILAGRSKIKMNCKVIPSIWSYQPKISPVPDIVHLAMDLRDKNMLPAICFVLNRTTIENFVSTLVEQLLSIEDSLKVTDKFYEKNRERVIKKATAEKKKNEEKILSQTEDFSKREKSLVKDYGIDLDGPVYGVRKRRYDYHMEGEDTKTQSMIEDLIGTTTKTIVKVQESTSNENYILELQHPYCTFVGKSDSSSQYVEKCISEYENKLSPNHRFLIQAMLRGIAIHHAGMPRKYLAATEALMRSGFITLVFGTGTLALGINMPCRTAVFLHDSVHLTPSDYQQMSGRAGRRGFDQEGYVLFAEIPDGKIDRLMCSELPAISGHFPLTTSIVLRMLLLETQAIPEENELNISTRKSKSFKTKLDRHEKDLAQAEDIIKNLTKNSLFCLGKVFSGDQTLHYFRASIAYLRKQQLIDRRGFLVNLSGLAVHLYYKEPDNFIFVTLYKHNVFHEICNNFIEDPSEVVFELAFLLCHIFDRKTIPLKEVKGMRAIAARSSSNIFLKPLPNKIVAIVEKHNDLVLSIYQNYCQRHSKSLGDTNYFLPSSKIEFNIDNTVELPAILNVLSNGITVKRTVARSPLSALPGKGDTFDCVEDMVSHIRKDIHLEGSAIPIVDTSIGKQGRLNSYLLDFLKHGQLRTIEKDNGIKEGMSFQALVDFELTLKSICVSLKQRMEAAREANSLNCVDFEQDANVLKGFEALRDTFFLQLSKYRVQKQKYWTKNK